MAKKSSLKKPVRVVLFGAQRIAIDCIRRIKNYRNAELLLVVAVEKDYDRRFEYDSVIGYCRKNSIPCESSYVTGALMKRLKSMKPDVVLSAYYRGIFPPELVSLPKIGCFNIHPSLLPEFRGPTPTAWAMLNQKKEFGITLHKIDKGIDTGDILTQKKYPIKPTETGHQLHSRSMTLGSKLLIKELPKILSNTFTARKQRGTGSYYGRLPSLQYINWRDSSDKILALIRVYSTPYNGARAVLNEREIIINRAVKLKSANPVQGPGIIIKVSKNGNIQVSASDGYIMITEFSFEKQNASTKKSVKAGMRFQIS
ncbi:MAG: hypothetical protein KC649_06910 [Candidatus Omnitrophica bacterium]|nr:hypothetical protein [Candidatus Omnitrophota bacterium]